MNDRMWEHAATRANVAAAARARRDGDRARRRVARLPRRVRAPGRLAEPADLLAAVEAAPARRRSGPLEGLQRPRHRRRHARADRRRALRRQPLLGADGLRAGRGGRAPRAPRSPSSPPTSRCRADPADRLRRRETAAELRAAAREAFAALRRAAHGRRRRRLPPGARRPTAKLKKDARRRPSSSSRPTDGRARRPGGRAAPGPDARRASRPSTATGAVEYGRGKLARKGLDLVVVNDVARPGIGFDAADNEVTLVSAGGGERAVPRADQGRGRAGHPRRGRPRAGRDHGGDRLMEPPGERRRASSREERAAAVALAGRVDAERPPRGRGRRRGRSTT